MKRRNSKDKDARYHFPPKSSRRENISKEMMKEQRQQTDYNRDGKLKIESFKYRSSISSTSKHFHDVRIKKLEVFEDQKPFCHDNLQGSISSVDRTLQSKQRDNAEDRRHSKNSQDTLQQSKKKIAESSKLDANVTLETSVPPVSAADSRAGNREYTLSKRNSSDSVIQNIIQETERSHTDNVIISRNEETTVSIEKSNVKVTQDYSLSKDDAFGKSVQNFAQESEKKIINSENKIVLSKDKTTNVERTNVLVNHESPSTSHRPTDAIASDCVCKLKKRFHTESTDLSNSTVFNDDIKRRKQDVINESISSESSMLCIECNDNSCDIEVWDASSCDTIINQPITHPESKANDKNQTVSKQAFHLDSEMLIKQEDSPLIMPVSINIAQVEMDKKSTDQQDSFPCTEKNINSKSNSKSKKDKYLLSKKQEYIIKRNRRREKTRKKFRILFGDILTISEDEEEKMILQRRYRKQTKQKSFDSNSCDLQDKCVEERYASCNIREEIKDTLKIYETLSSETSISSLVNVSLSNETSISNSERDTTTSTPNEEFLRNDSAVVNTENIISENNASSKDSINTEDIHKKDLKTLLLSLCETIKEIRLELDKNTQKSILTQNLEENKKVCDVSNAILTDKDKNSKLITTVPALKTTSDIEKEGIDNCDVSQNIANSLLVNNDSVTKDVKDAIIDCISPIVPVPKETENSEHKNNSVPMDTFSDKLNTGTNNTASLMDNVFSDNIDEIEIELNIKQPGCTKFSLKIPLSIMTTCNINKSNIFKFNDFLQTISQTACEMTKQKKEKTNEENSTLKVSSGINQDTVTNNTETSSIPVMCDSSLNTTKNTNHSLQQQDSQDNATSSSGTNTIEHNKVQRNECVTSIEQEKEQTTTENSVESSTSACNVSDLGKQLPKNCSDDVRKTNEQSLDTHSRIRVRSNQELGCSSFMNLNTTRHSVQSVPSQSATRLPPSYASSNNCAYSRKDDENYIIHINAIISNIALRLKYCRMLVSKHIRNNVEVQQESERTNEIETCKIEMTKDIEKIARILTSKEYQRIIIYVVKSLNLHHLKNPTSISEFMQFTPHFFKYFNAFRVSNNVGNVSHAPSSSTSTSNINAQFSSNVGSVPHAAFSNTPISNINAQFSSNVGSAPRAPPSNTSAPNINVQQLYCGNVPHVPFSRVPEVPNIRPHFSHMTHSNSMMPNITQQQSARNMSNFPQMLRSEQPTLNINQQSSRRVSDIPPVPHSVIPTTNVERSLRGENNLTSHVQMPFTNIINTQQFSGDISHTQLSNASIPNVNIHTSGSTVQKSTNVPLQIDNRHSVTTQRTTTRTNPATSPVIDAQQSQFFQRPSQIDPRSSFHPPPMTNRDISPNTSNGVHMNTYTINHVSVPNNIMTSNVPLNLSSAPKTGLAKGSVLPRNINLQQNHQIPKQVPIILAQQYVPRKPPPSYMYHVSHVPQESAPNTRILHEILRSNAQVYETLPNRMSNVPVMKNTMQQSVTNLQQQPLLSTNAPTNVSKNKLQNVQRSVISDKAEVLKSKNRDRKSNKSPSVRPQQAAHKKTSDGQVSICQDLPGKTSPMQRPNISQNMASNVSSSSQTKQTSSIETYKSVTDKLQIANPQQSNQTMPNINQQQSSGNLNKHDLQFLEKLFFLKLNQLKLNFLTDIQKIILYDQINKYFNMPKRKVPKEEQDINLLCLFYMSLRFDLENIMRKGNVIMQENKISTSKEITQQPKNNSNGQTCDPSIKSVFMATESKIICEFFDKLTKKSKNEKTSSTSTPNETIQNSKLVKLQEKNKNIPKSQSNTVSLDIEKESRNAETLEECLNISEENLLTEACRENLKTKTQRTVEMEISTSLSEDSQLCKTSASLEQNVPDSSQDKLTDKTKEKSNIVMTSTPTETTIKNPELVKLQEKNNNIPKSQSNTVSLDIEKESGNAETSLQERLNISEENSLTEACRENSKTETQRATEKNEISTSKDSQLCKTSASLEQNVPDSSQDKLTDKTKEKSDIVTTSTPTETTIKNPELVKLQEKNNKIPMSQSSVILDTEKESRNAETSLQECSNISEENSLTEACRENSKTETQRATEKNEISTSKDSQLCKTSASLEQNVPDLSQDKLLIPDKTKERRTSVIITSHVNTKNNNFVETENINESSVNTQGDTQKENVLQSLSCNIENQNKEVCNASDEMSNKNRGDRAQESNLNSSEIQFDRTLTSFLSNDKLGLTLPLKKREYVEMQKESRLCEILYEEYLLSDRLSEFGIKMEPYDFTDEERDDTAEMYKDLNMYWSIEEGTGKSNLDSQREQRKEPAEKGKLNTLQDTSRTFDTMKPMKTLDQSNFLEDISDMESVDLCQSSATAAQDVIKPNKQSPSKIMQIQESPFEISHDVSSVAKSTTPSIDKTVKQHEKEEKMELSVHNTEEVNEQLKHSSDLEYHDKSQISSCISVEKNTHTNINEEVPSDDDILILNDNVNTCDRVEITDNEAMDTPNILDVRSISQSLFENMHNTEDMLLSSYDLELLDRKAKEELIAINNNSKILNVTEPCLRCKRRSTVCCEVCLVAYYCSERCFSLHWITDHHKNCKPVKT